MNDSRTALDAHLEEIRRLRASPPDEQQRARWRAALETMDRLRVKVGRDFNTTEVLRELRESASSADLELQTRDGDGRG